MNDIRTFDNNMLHGYKLRNLNNIVFKYSFFFLIILLTIVPSLAVSPHEIQGGIPENKTCTDCHTSHETMNIPSESSRISIENTPRVSRYSSIQSFAATDVVGNITLISRVGQNWFQQGIYGPATGNDNSWGWTFFDENPASGFINPSENVTQRENIYALLLDDGNNSNPISGATVMANVIYWTYDGSSYINQTTPVQLIEDNDRKGFYSGKFDFYGGTTYSSNRNMRNCDGCHGQNYWGTIDNLAGFFPGNYSVIINAETNSKNTEEKIDFEVTPWGCEGCHGSGNQHNWAGLDADSACYLCHGANSIPHGPTLDAGNPHQNKAHANINCEDCHTNKSINQQTFTGVTFTSGGLNGNVPQYNSNVIQLNKGVHSALSCIYCHNDTTLPSPEGGYSASGYAVADKINRKSSFADMRQFQDYYIVNVESGSSYPLNITFNWEGAVNPGFYLFPPGFNPINRTSPSMAAGGVPGSSTKNLYISSPNNGKWILALYGYNLTYDFLGMIYWGGILQPPINYTVNSTYPIQKKDLPSTPECNDCHYSGGSGRANTTFEIPDWNPGFAHVDTNGDGTLDIQCRMCHDSMHDIGIKKCQNCHTKAPTNHPIHDPAFIEYSAVRCLACHGDPHRVTFTGGTDCIGCHVPKDVNASKFARHANINISDGGQDNVTNSDCLTCHYKQDMNRSNVYLCGSCHSNKTGIVSITNESLVMSGFMHDGTECRTCHAPIGRGYHLNATVGPLGTVEKILKKLQNP